MGQSFFVSIVNNIALLIALGFLYSLCTRRWDIEKMQGKVIAGLLFGSVALIGMLLPVQYAPGIIFDGRTILVGIIGLFGGWISAAIAVLMTGALRIWQGGAGQWAGAATILSAAFIGVVFRILRTRYSWKAGWLFLLGFGFIVHLSMLACMLILPESIRWRVLTDISLPVLLIYPVGTMLYGRLIVELEARNAATIWLREKEQLYAALAESSTAGIGLRDAQNRFVYANKALAVMLDAEDPAQLIGLRYIDFVHPDDQAETLRRISENNQGVVSSRREHSLVSRNGRIVLVESTGVPIQKDGNCFIMGVFQDITERKKMEDTLRENEERYRAMMQQSNEAILLVDVDTKKILEVNPRCEELFGYSEAELQYMTTYDLVDDSVENIDRRNLAILSGTEIDERILTVRCKGGRTIEVERTARIIHYSGKHVFMFVNRDLSAERKLQEMILKDVIMAAGVQKDLLPSNIDDLLVVVETIYRPHHLVSGDFFDYMWSDDQKRFSGFLLDVSGHGVSSSLQCVAVSTYFRDVLASPMRLDAKLKWINRHVMRFFSNETFAAALCFEFDFTRQTLTFATAGIYGFITSSSKLPTVVKQPGSLLGILENPEYNEWTVPIQAGDTFYFMSDGLFELITPDIELKLEEFKNTVRQLHEAAESTRRRDDCSAVCVRVSGRPNFPVRLEFHRYAEYERVRIRIRYLLRSVSEEEAPKMEIAVGEALANASRQSMDIRVKISLFGNRLVVRILDGGQGFDGRKRVEEYRLAGMESEFLDRLYAENGRGILIMMAWMDEVIYSRKGNEVLLVKSLSGTHSHGKGGGSG